DIRWFPTHVAIDLRSPFDELAAVEMRVEGLGDDDDAYDLAMASLESTSRSVLEDAFCAFALMAVENTARPVSRLRSYKRFLSRHEAFKVGRCLEREVPIEASNTVFVALVEIG